jgi:hypothetical protein
MLSDPAFEYVTRSEEPMEDGALKTRAIGLSAYES